MFVFPAFHGIRKLSSEKLAASTANFILKHIPRNRATSWFTDEVRLWVYAETNYRECRECFNFVIADGYPNRHDACRKARDLEEKEFQEAYERNQRELAKLEEEEAQDALEEQAWQAYLAEQEREMQELEDESYDDDVEDEDPLAGDVDPTGGYPEEYARIQTGYGNFEVIAYDPNNPKEWPLKY